jgi:hypothetical protein
MTLANIIETGYGRLRARLSVAGFASFVSDLGMVQTAGDGRPWLNGLNKDTIKWSVRADLMRASLSAEGFTATIVDDQGGKVTAALAKRPTVSTSLIVAVNSSTGTIPVASTSGFDASGVIHLATEAIAYASLGTDGSGNPAFLGCTRGVWGTTAQYHYIGDGAGLAFPKVTNCPQSLEGRPVEVALYGDGDSGTGNGTVAFRGVCNRGARFSAGTWTVGVDPITRILEQNIGDDLSKPVPIRGIHYTSAAPLILILNWNDGADVGTVRLVGFFEDQAAFCDELTDQIATATAGFGWGAGSSIIAVPSDIGWDLVYTIGAAGTAANVSLDTTRIPVPAGTRIGDRVTTTLLDDQIDPLWVGGDGASVTAPVLSGVYTMRWAASVPRATLGLTDERPDTVFVGASLGDPHRIYLGGSVIPSTGMVLYIDDGEDSTPIEINDVDTTDRWMEVGASFRVLGPDTELRIGRVLAPRTTLNGLRAILVSDSPQYANTGAMPLIASADLADSDEVDDAAYANLAIGWGRTFVAFGGFTLGELVEQELRALGCYQTINASGAILWRKLRATMTTDTAAASIGEDDVIGWPTMERGQFGLVSVVAWKTGWEPKENEHLGQLYTFRDVGACSPNRVSMTHEVGQLSLPRVLRGFPTLTLSDVRSAVAPVLGLFGTEYDIIQLDVGLKFLSLLVGDVVSLTSSKVPSIDGTRGVTGEVCMVTTVGLDVSTGKVGLQLIRHGQRVAGYAPEFPSPNGNVDPFDPPNFIYDVTCLLPDYTDRANMSDWFTVGETVKVLEKDVASPTSYYATITSFPAADIVRLTFSAPFVYGTSEWSVGLAESTFYASTDDLARFMFSATTTRKITHSDTSVDARVFSP